MNIRDAKQEIIHTIMAYTAKDQWGNYAIPQGRQRPLLLIGPPGIGKTAIMEQAAAQCGVGFVSYTMTHHTRQSAIGLPYIRQEQFEGREYSVTEYTMSEIIASVYQCMRDSGKKEGLLFLDEINCVSETLAPVMLQFLQNKTFGNQRLPEGWILAAAGNPSEYNKSVREFDLATLDRLKYIAVEADYEAWRSYALSAGIHGAILSYLDTHQERFYVLRQTYTEKAFATARGWEDLSCILLQYESLQLPVTSDLIGQYLHQEELARDFSGYYMVYTTRRKILPVLEMMQGESAARQTCRTFFLDGSIDEKLLLMHLCLSVLEHHLQEYESDTLRFTSFQEALHRLLRYLDQHASESFSKTISDFLKKEEDVLRIRREHGLSPETEIQNTRAMLYELRQLFYEYEALPDLKSKKEAPHALKDYLEAACHSRETTLTSKARQIQDMTDQCLKLFQESPDAVFTLLLSSLSANNSFARFIKKNPCPLFEEQQERLQFQTREAQLRQELKNMTEL